MSAYMIARVEVTDLDKFKQYSAAAGMVTEKFGGKYLARGGSLEGLENFSDAGKRVVIIEFADLATANAWYNSDEYQEAKKLRENAATGNFLIVDGC